MLMIGKYKIKNPRQNNLLANVNDLKGLPTLEYI